MRSTFLNRLLSNRAMGKIVRHDSHCVMSYLMMTYGPNRGLCAYVRCASSHVDRVSSQFQCGIIMTRLYIFYMQMNQRMNTNKWKGELKHPVVSLVKDSMLLENKNLLLYYDKRSFPLTSVSQPICFGLENCQVSQ